MVIFGAWFAVAGGHTCFRLWHGCVQGEPKAKLDPDSRSRPRGRPPYQQ